MRWVASAGLGDSLSAMSSAFLATLKVGRLFLIDWTSPLPWSVGLSPPRYTPSSRPYSAAALDVDGQALWDWDWHSLHCSRGSPSGMDVIELRGSPSVGHPIVVEMERAAARAISNAPELADLTDGAAKMKFSMAFPREWWLLRQLVAPAPALARALEPAAVVLNGSFVVGLQVRTGARSAASRSASCAARLSSRCAGEADSGPRPSFLAADDHLIFFRCAKAFVDQHALPDYRCASAASSVLRPR